MKKRLWSFLAVFVLLLGAFVFQMSWGSNNAEAIMVYPLSSPIDDLTFEAKGDYLTWSTPSTGIAIDHYQVRYFTGTIPIHSDNYDRSDFGGCSYQTQGCGTVINSSYVEGGYNRVDVTSWIYSSKQNWIVTAVDTNGVHSQISNIVTTEDDSETAPYETNQSRAWVSGGEFYWYPTENVDSYKFSYYSGRKNTNDTSGYNTCAPDNADFTNVKVEYQSSVCHFMNLIDVDFIPNEVERISFDEYSISSDYEGITMRVEGYNKLGSKVMDYYGDFISMEDPYVEPLDEVGNLSLSGTRTISWNVPVLNENIQSYGIGFLTGRRTDNISSINSYNVGCNYWNDCAGDFLESSYYPSTSIGGEEFVVENFRVARPGNTYYVYYRTTDGRTSPVAGPIYVPSEFEPTDYFPDISTYRYRTAINELAERNVVEGFLDGTYRPYNTIGRAEFTKILVLSAYGSEYTNVADSYNYSCFDDVAANEWHTRYICFAKARGLIKGYDDGSFQPFKAIAGSEATKIVMEGYNLAPINADSYEGNWYYPYLEKADQLGMLVETIDNRFWSGYADYAGSLMNRGEIARLIQMTGLAWDRTY